MKTYQPVRNAGFLYCGPNKIEKDSSVFVVCTRQWFPMASGADSLTLPPHSGWPKTAVILFYAIKARQKNEKLRR